jgi:dTDP-4-amino-4,6-dideoxygalactose transaminase
MIKFLDLKAVNQRFEPDMTFAIQRVISSGWFILGEEVKTFEKKYADFIGVKYCVGVANGLKGYMTLGIFKPGDEIIVPANTYIASLLAISGNGLKPVLIEPDLFTYNLDSSKIEEKISVRTRAIMLVHLYGQCGMNNDIKQIIDKYNLKLIEDNAQSSGCFYNEVRTGSIGDSSGHSFYPGKNLGCIGDGGAITTNNKELAEIVRTLANYGSKIKYVNDHLGVNSRLDEIQAAILNLKLTKLDEDNEARNLLADNYCKLLKGVGDLIIPEKIDGYNSVYHLYVIRTNFRDELQQFLRESGIETSIHYPIPPHLQKAYVELGFKNGKFPVTEFISDTCLSLPISPVLTISETEFISESIKSFFQLNIKNNKVQ